MPDIVSGISGGASLIGGLFGGGGDSGGGTSGLVSGLINAGGSIGNALIGSNASGDAADAQSAASAESNALQRYIYEKNSALTEDQLGRIAPYYTLGTEGLKNLSSLANEGPGNYQASPGYQFRLSEGEKALNRSAAARGNALGGAQLKALTKYGQDYATNDYQNFLNRYYQSLTPFQTLANYGQQATGQQGNILAAQLGQGQNYANAVSSLNKYSGDAQAQGSINSANALTGGISSGINNYNTGRYINQLTSPRTSTYSGYSSSPTWDIPSNALSTYANDWSGVNWSAGS